MLCEDVVLTGPCLAAEVVDGALVLNIEADGTTLQCTDEGLQAIGGGFSAVNPISWSGLTPSCICSNAVRQVNGGTELFAPELYAFQFSARDGRNNPNTPNPSPGNPNPNPDFKNAIGVEPPFQPGNPDSFHPVFGWDADRHEFNFGTVGAPIVNPYCRPMFLWFLIRTRLTVTSGFPVGTLVHQSSYSLNGAPEARFNNLTLPRSNTVDVTFGSSVMNTPSGLVGVQVPPGGSFYLTVFNWVDQFGPNFSLFNEWFDSEIQIDAMALAYSGNPPANGCPVVGI